MMTFWNKTEAIIGQWIADISPPGRADEALSVRREKTTMVSVTESARDFRAAERLNISCFELRETLLRSMNTMPDAMVGIDNHGTIQAFGSSAAGLFGYSEKEIVGHSIRTLIPSPFRSQYDRYLTRYLSANERHIIGVARTIFGRRKVGSTFPIELIIGEVARLEGWCLSIFVSNRIVSDSARPRL